MSMRTTMAFFTVLIGIGAGCAIGSKTQPLEKELVVITAVDIQSAHPYANYTNQQWEIDSPVRALSIGVVFDRFETEEDFDFVNIYDIDGTLVHHLSGYHTGEFFEVHGRYMRIEFVSDYSVRDWGFQISEYRIETTDPGHPVDHRPYCGFAGTPQEGWYWGDTEQLIGLERCDGKDTPVCGAISSRSEGWYTNAPDALITWDRVCHLLSGIALFGEPCDGGTALTCYDGLICQGPTATTPGICVTEPQGVWSWTTHLIRDMGSAHPYENNTDETVDVVGGAGATQIKVLFGRIDTEAGYDPLVLSGDVQENAVMLDGHHIDEWSPIFEGNTIHINFQSDYSITDWGWQATQVSFYEQLPVGACNTDADCGAEQYCFPHRCFSPFAPCYGHCEATNGGDVGDVCDGASRLCDTGLFCKELSPIGEGTCQDEFWCSPATVAADCADLIHIAVPGQWACGSNVCTWQPTQFPTEITNLQKYDIPDNDPAGIQSDITASSIPACTLAVGVDLHVDHSYRGDLVVILTSPGGQTQTLHDREGGSADNLDLQNAPVDAALLADGPNGTWSLHVSDHAALDVGTHTYWTLRFTCQ
jgi:subtilisin-like proprotein convertase family protein